MIDEWEAQPRHRNPVFARDGWRAVSARSARRELQDHHIVFRSRDGGNKVQNRIALCASHHHRGIHASVIRAWGEAPHTVRWHLGVRASGPPFLAYVGDRLDVDATDGAGSQDCRGDEAGVSRPAGDFASAPGVDQRVG